MRQRPLIWPSRSVACWQRRRTICDKGGFNAFRKRHCPSLGKSRAYELLAIATGKKSIEQSRAEGRARQERHVKKLRATAAAMRSSVSDPNNGLRQFTGWVLELVLLTETAKPADFVSTTASSDDLIKLGNFLAAVADSQRRPKLRVV